MLRLDSAGQSAWIGDRGIPLTGMEFRLLAILAADPRKTFRRDELLALLDPGTVVGVRTIDVHIAALRRKLCEPRLIVTVRGQGYRLE